MSFFLQVFIFFSLSFRRPRRPRWSTKKKKKKTHQLSFVPPFFPPPKQARQEGRPPPADAQPEPRHSRGDPPGRRRSFCCARRGESSLAAVGRRRGRGPGRLRALLPQVRELMQPRWELMSSTALCTSKQKKERVFQGLAGPLTTKLKKKTQLGRPCRA